jgi:hypothetical protein
MTAATANAQTPPKMKMTTDSQRKIMEHLGRISDVALFSLVALMGVAFPNIASSAPSIATSSLRRQRSW